MVGKKLRNLFVLESVVITHSEKSTGSSGSKSASDLTLTFWFELFREL